MFAFCFFVLDFSTFFFFLSLQMLLPAEFDQIICCCTMQYVGIIDIISACIQRPGSAEKITKNVKREVPPRESN